MFFYLPVSLPLPPTNLINEIMDPAFDLTQEPAQKERFRISGGKYLERSLTYQEKVYQTRVQYRYLLTNELKQWLDDNLPSNYLAASLAVSKGNSPVHGPHIDYNRHYILYLSLANGGNNVLTSFWRKPGCPIEFESPEWPGIAQDYPNLEHLTSVVLKPNQWYLLNGWIYHSVENVESDRVSLQIDYDQINLCPK